MSIADYVAIAAGVVAVLAYVESKSRRLGALEVKVDTMWKFLMRRAKVEGKNRGMITENSPIIVRPDVRLAYSALFTELKKVGQNYEKLTDENLELLIERLLGERLAAEICPVLQTSVGTCLVIARQIARELAAIPAVAAAPV